MEDQNTRKPLPENTPDLSGFIEAVKKGDCGPVDLRDGSMGREEVLSFDMPPLENDEFLYSFG